MLIAHLRRLGQEHQSHIADLEAFYRDAKKEFDEDPQFQAEARQTVVRLQGGEPEELALWQSILEETRSHYQPIYDDLGVKLRREDECGESFYNPQLSQVVADLKAAGIAEESDGATVVFVDGFETPLIIEKTGGGFLYATTDLAAIRYRIRQLGAGRIVYTHDARQAQHFAQVFATARRAGWAEGVGLDYAPFGTMLGEDGRPFKTRSGDTVKLRGLLDEAVERAYALVNAKNADLPEAQRRNIARAVGIGAVKYSDLSKDRVSDYVFSWEKMLAMDGNTAPYLQYAYARIQSIFRKADGDRGAGAALHLDGKHELALAKHILRLGEIVDLVGPRAEAALPLHVPVRPCHALQRVLRELSRASERGAGALKPPRPVPPHCPHHGAGAGPAGDRAPGADVEPRPATTVTRTGRTFSGPARTCRARARRRESLHPAVFPSRSIVRTVLPPMTLLNMPTRARDLVESASTPAVSTFCSGYMRLRASRM